MKSTLRNVVSRIGAGNVLALYGIQFCNYLLPVIVVPLLARSLGPQGWGLLAIAQSGGAYLIMAIEYGFDLSATREVARHKNDPERRARTFSEVMAAKALLALAVITLATLYVTLTDTGSEYSVLIWSTVFWSIGGGCNVVWYFHGLQRMRLVAGLEISARVAGAIAAVLAARGPGDAWKVLICQGGATAVSTGVAFLIVCFESGLRWPTLSQVTHEFRRGWAMFLYRGSSTLTASGNALFLGYLAGPVIAGYYASAEKISRACVGMIYPFFRTVYPVLSNLQHRRPGEANALARWITFWMAIAGAAGGTLMFVLSPLLVHVLLGPKFGAAVPVLRIMALILPLSALNMALVYQWVLPLLLERALTKIVVCAGCFNFLIIALLTRVLQEQAGAWGAVSAETVSLVGVVLLLTRMQSVDLAPETRRPREIQGSPELAEVLSPNESSSS